MAQFNNTFEDSIAGVEIENKNYEKYKGILKLLFINSYKPLIEPHGL